MNAPFPRRVLRSYQEKATTYLLIASRCARGPARSGMRGRCSRSIPHRPGHGLNLQHGGSRMAWLSPSWSAELTEQAIARVYRPGQTRHVTVHVCVAAGTVDEMKRDRVIGKMSAQEAFKRHLEQI